MKTPPAFKSGDLVRYPNKGYDYRIVEHLGWDQAQQSNLYLIVFDKPFSRAGEDFKAEEIERALVHKTKWVKS